MNPSNLDISLSRVARVSSVNSLTFPILPDPAHGVHPELLLLMCLCYQHKPLVLGYVVDFPAVGYLDTVGVVVTWENRGRHDRREVGRRVKGRRGGA